MAPEPIGYFAVLDLEFSVTAEEPLATWLASALSAFATTRAAGHHRLHVQQDTAGTWEVWFDDDQVCRRTQAHQLLHRLSVDLNSRIAASTNRHLVLHAGVIGSARGTMVLAAPSGSGKSTMVATAAMAGWGYGGDEHAALRYADVLVDPLPKPIGLKYGSAPHFVDLADPDPLLADFFREQLFVAPGALPGGVLRGPHPVALIVLPLYDPDCRQVTVELLSQAEGVMALRENAFNFALDPVRAFRTLTSLVRAAPVLRVRYDDAASALGVLLDYGT